MSIEITEASAGAVFLREQRAVDGRRAAARGGKRMGRRPKLNERQRANARRMLAEGLPLREVAREMNVHHSTIARL